MAYCTQQDLEDRKGTEQIAQLTGDPTGQEVDAARVTLVINEFAARVDGALRRQYPEGTFDSSNALLNGLNVEGAFLLLAKDTELGWSEDHREDWKMLLKELDKIGDGTVDLRTETEEQEQEISEGYFSSRPRFFGRTSLSGEGVTV